MRLPNFLSVNPLKQGLSQHQVLLLKSRIGLLPYSNEISNKVILYKFFNIMISNFGNLTLVNRIGDEENGYHKHIFSISMGETGIIIEIKDDESAILNTESNSVTDRNYTTYSFNNQNFIDRGKRVSQFSILPDGSIELISSTVTYRTNTTHEYNVNYSLEIAEILSIFTKFIVAEGAKSEKYYIKPTRNNPRILSNFQTQAFNLSKEIESEDF